MRVLVATFLAISLLRAAPERTEPFPQANGHVAVLMYHHFALAGERSDEPGVMTPERFEDQLRMLRTNGYRLITAADFAAYLDGTLTLPGRSVLLTFDDGYESNYTRAFPLMKKYHAPGLIFPVMKYFTTYGRGAWSPHLVMEQAQEMLASGLVAFGGHTYDGHGTVTTGPTGESGPWLTSRAWVPAHQRHENDAEYRLRIREDLERTRDLLRELGVQDEALHFALPNGLGRSATDEELHALGFRYIYSTDGGRLNDPSVDKVFRIDAGSPHVTVEWLQERLAAEFRRTQAGQE